MLTVDYIGPKKKKANWVRPENGFLLVVDAFSKKAHIQFMNGASAREALKAFYIILTSLGSTNTKLCFSDAGSIFESGLWEDSLLLKGIQVIRAAPRHQHSNGICERAYRTLKTILKLLIHDYPELTWHEAMDMAVLSYNQRPKKPFNRSPNQLSQATGEDLIRIRTKYNLIWAKHDSQHHDFKIGDMVLLRNVLNRKGEKPVWLGPFRIQEIVGSQMCRLSNNRRLQHVKDLKKYMGNRLNMTQQKAPLHVLKDSLQSPSSMLSETYHSIQGQLLSNISCCISTTMKH